jgi:3-phenylpropionate/trans-cinnamate dioxygenase ferredoxin component
MKRWVEAGDEAEFERADRKQVEVEPGRWVGVFKVGAEYFAVDAICSHEHASLLLGDVDGHEVMCPLHGARFDLRTGKHLSLPAVRPVRSYRVKAENGKIYVEI